MATTKRVTPGREGYKILFDTNTVIMNKKFAAAAAKYGTMDHAEPHKSGNERYDCGGAGDLRICCMQRKECTAKRV